jgi:hypothetical protein
MLIRGFCLAAMALMVPIVAQSAEPDWKKVEQALGKEGMAQPGGSYKFALPRSDLKVAVDDVQVQPALALGSWLAFKPMGEAAMVMGDLVLTEAEIEPVMLKLERGGIQITALHNHLLRAQPTTMYMHVLGHGDPVKLAAALHDGLAQSKTPMGPPAGAQTQGSSLDAAMLERVLGFKGKAAGSVYQFSIPRAEKIVEDGIEIDPAMGTAIAINFQPNGERRAAITGDFVLRAAEVNPVLRALRQNGIEVTALHSHMLSEQPRLFFMHFWANDDAEKLARGLRAALDKCKTAKG